MKERINFKSGTKWEEQFSYSRAVRKGKSIFVSGTTAVDENGTIQGLGSIAHQLKFILNKIKIAVEKCDGSFTDIVRVRIYIVDLSLWEEASDVFAKTFSGIDPAATLIEVKSLIEPDLLIELEADAITDD